MAYRRTHEEYINSFPNYITAITGDDGDKYEVHFSALISKNPNAVPIIGIHGWPGEFSLHLTEIRKLTPSKEVSLSSYL